MPIAIERHMCHWWQLSELISPHRLELFQGFGRGEGTILLRQHVGDLPNRAASLTQSHLTSEDIGSIERG